MANQDLELFDANPDWRPLLAAYQDRHPAGKLQWSARLDVVEDIPSERLPAIHGKLIALGLLKFDLDGKSGGMLYQPTPLGRQALLPPEQRSPLQEWQTADEAA